MSGIVGFLNKNASIDSLSVLKRMITRIKHRGLGYNAVYVSRYIGLGVANNFPVTQNDAVYPFSNEDETMWIVWSGTLFNRSDLKLRLLKLGIRLKNESDGGLILHLYQLFGTSCFSMLNGQFAFSIWDSNRKELIMVRDRVGVCPLFYAATSNGFVFASEMKALFVHPKISAKISSKALKQVVTFWTTIAPDTIFEGVLELSPGHYLTLNSDELKTESYWEFPVSLPDEYLGLNITESMEQFDEVFTDAVAIRTQTDKPFGAYLSGGLDSSVTTAYIRKMHPQLNLDTFSISFTDPIFDESNFQKIATDYYNTNHSKVICSDEDVISNFQEIVWHAEAPLLRTAPVPMFLLSKLVRKNNIQTIISGEGADEILGGYNIFKEALIREFWAKEPNSKYRPLLLKKLYPYLSQMNMTNNMALKTFFGYKLTETSSPVYSHILRWNNTARIMKFFSTYLKYEVSDYNPVDEYLQKVESKLRGVDLLSRAQYIEATTFMSGYLLNSQGERMAMANTVEARYPFLDHRVIELCMKIRPEYKLKGLSEKYLLKTMMKDKVPKEIVARQKQPYRAPIASLFNSNYGLSLITEEVLSKDKILSTGLFDYKKVDLLLQKMKLNHRITEIDNMAITAILSTQILYNCFIDKTVSTLSDSELIKLDRIIYDKKFNYV